jgi:hypothetical protein
MLSCWYVGDGRPHCSVEGGCVVRRGLSLFRLLRSIFDFPSTLPIPFAGAGLGEAGLWHHPFGE